MVTVIAAVSRNGFIGKDNGLLWNLPSDMKYFKETTMGGTVVMGRKTYESIGRPLPGRRNIVISRFEGLTYDGVEVYHSLNEALSACDRVCFVIGGSEVYTQAMPHAHRLLLTIIDEDFDGDATFPDYSSGWIKISDRTVDPDEKNKYRHTFVEYEMCKF